MTPTQADAVHGMRSGDLKMSPLSTAPDTVIELSGVSKTFQLYPSALGQLLEAIRIYPLLGKKAPGGAKTALSNVDLSIKAGEKVGLIGQNGSGKSTLLKLIVDIARPTSGQVRVDGKVQALMTTGAAISDELSGSECIKSALILNGLADREEREAYDDIVDFVELGEFLNYPVRAYSLGMRARLEFAIATAIKPDILVIDEVMGAGDGYFAQKSAKRMRELTAHCTLLLVSHSMQQIVDFCDRVIWLNDGEIVVDGPPGRVIKSYEDFMVKRDAQIRTSIQMAEHAIEQDARPEEEQMKSILDTRTETARKKSQAMLAVGGPAGRDLPRLSGGSFADGMPIYSTETGKPVEIDVSFSIPEGWRDPVFLSILAFSESGNLIWTSRGLAVGSDAGERTLTIFTGKIIAGVGDYFLSIGVEGSDKGGPPFFDVLHTHLILRLITTNFSDPPFFHCPGEWRYDGNENEPVDGRISAWV